MKKISRYLLLAAVVMAVFAASGCARSDKGAVFDPDQSSIFVKKDGSVLSASVEHSDQNYYSEEELKSFMEGRLSEFNAAQGRGGQAGSPCNRQRREPAGRRRSGGKHVPGRQGKLR